jgi:hypothetical protein
MAARAKARAMGQAAAKAMATVDRAHEAAWRTHNFPCFAY